MRLLVAFMTIWVVSLANAAPNVIYDSGQTQSLKGYLAQIKEPKAQRTQTPLGQMPRVYPVITPELSPATVTPRSINYPQLQQPLFIIGYDHLSLRWLTLFKTTLLQHKAVGLVVNVDHPQQFEEIQAIAPGLEMHPGPGSQLAKTLGFKHYPVLISTTRIEQ